MNKQSKANRRLALKNYHRGTSKTDFAIYKTVPGSSLATRTHSIEIGNFPRKTKSPKVGGKKSKFVTTND